MHVQAILIPLFIQVALTFALVVRMALMRRAALRSGAARESEVVNNPQNWPERSRQVANAFRNQFELPVLFYVLCILAIITRQADTLFVVLAWIFVLSRLVHAYIQTTYNRLAHRGLAFAVGCMTLMLMWLIFAIDIVIGV
jgi:hypothetical protein